MLLLVFMHLLCSMHAISYIMIMISAMFHNAADSLNSSSLRLINHYTKKQGKVKA